MSSRKFYLIAYQIFFSEFKHFSCKLFGERIIEPVERELVLRVLIREYSWNYSRGGWESQCVVRSQRTQQVFIHGSRTKTNFCDEVDTKCRIIGALEIFL